MPPPRGGDAHPLLARQRERVLDLLGRARRHHADRHDLVVRGVGGVAPAGEGVELHLAEQLRLEAAFQAGHHRFRHSSCPCPASAPFGVCAPADPSGGPVTRGRASTAADTPLPPRYSSCPGAIVQIQAGNRPDRPVRRAFHVPGARVWNAGTARWTVPLSHVLTVGTAGQVRDDAIQGAGRCPSSRVPEGLERRDMGYMVAVGGPTTSRPFDSDLLGKPPRMAVAPAITVSGIQFRPWAPSLGQTLDFGSSNRLLSHSLKRRHIALFGYCSLQFLWTQTWLISENVLLCG